MVLSRVECFARHHLLAATFMLGILRQTEDGSVEKYSRDVSVYVQFRVKIPLPEPSYFRS